MSPSFEYNATVSRRIEVTDTLCILHLKNDAPFSDFKPGQFTMVGLTPDSARCAHAEAEEVKRKPTDPIIRRAYSICSDPQNKETYEIYLSLVKTGELTSRMFNLKEGDRVWNSGKATGFFTTERISETKGLLMLSTGTGVAPFISMLRVARREKWQRPLVLVHAIDVSDQLAYDEELKAYQQEAPNFHYFPVVTFPDREPSWKGLTGWIQDDIRNHEYEKRAQLEFTPDNTHAMLCGNPNMIKAAIEALEERGFKHGKAKDPEATIFTEEYW